MPSQTWSTVFPGNASFVRKALYGSVFVLDWTGTTNWSTYSPFDAASGELVTTLLTTDGWNDLGYLDDSGVEFTPNYTVADTVAWQTRLKLRTDATEDTEQAKFSCLESRPIVDALYNNLAIASVPATGSTAYTITKPLTPQIVYRSILFLGVDGSTNNEAYVGTLYPKCLMVKPDKQSWTAKDEIQTGLSFQAYPDALSGFAVKRFREGPAWRALGLPGGVGTVVATPGVTQLSTSWTTATVPTGAPALTNYTVTANKVSDGSAAAGSPFTVAAGTTTKVITSLTTGQPYTVTVKANNSNGSGPISTVVGTPT